MTPFSFFSKLLIFPLYYFFHYNFVFGLLHKKFIKKFYYKKYIFELNNCDFPIPFYSSFIFNTYELNDRVLIEKNVTSENKCIIVGGGIGFIGVLTSVISKNKILIFEINKKILSNLKNNLKKNKIKYSLYPNNLVFQNRNNKKYYFFNQNFLASSMYRKTNNRLKINNLHFKKIKSLNKYNTLIIDGKSIEKYYIENINKLKMIKYIFFEFHNDIFSREEKNHLFDILKKNGFTQKDKFINSYYFSKKK